MQTQQNYQQLCDFLSRQVVAYSQSYAVLESFKQQNCSIDLILQQLPNIKVDTQLDIFRGTKAPETLHLQQLRFLYVPVNSLQHVAFNYYSAVQQQEQMLEKIQCHLRGCIDGCYQNLKQAIETLPLYLKNSQFDYLDNVTMHLHFAMANESAEQLSAQTDHFLNAKIAGMEQEIQGFDDSDYQKYFIFVKKDKAPFQIDSEVQKKLADAKARYFVLNIADSHFEQINTKSAFQRNNLYFYKIFQDTQNQELDLNAFAAFMKLMEEIKHFYCQFVREKIYTLALTLSEQQKLFKKEVLYTATFCAPKLYYGKFSMEQKYMRLISLLITHQTQLGINPQLNASNNYLESLIQEAISKHGKSQKQFAVFLFYARFLNCVNNYIQYKEKTVENNVQIKLECSDFLNFYKISIMQINDSFQQTTKQISNSNCNYSNSQINTQLDMLLKHQSQIIYQSNLLKDFKSAFMQNQQFVYKIKLELFFALSYIYICNEQQMMNSQNVDILQQVRIIQSVMTRRDLNFLTNQYLVVICQLYNSIVIKDIISYSKQFINVKNYITQTNQQLQPKLQLYNNVLAWRGLLQLQQQNKSMPDYVLSSQQIHLINQFQKFNYYDSIKQCVLNYYLQSIKELNFQQSNTNSIHELPDAQKQQIYSTMEDLLGKPANLKQIKQSPFKCHYFLMMNQKLAPEITTLILKYSQAIKLQLMKISDVKILCNNIDEKFNIIVKKQTENITQQLSLYMSSNLTDHPQKQQQVDSHHEKLQTQLKQFYNQILFIDNFTILRNDLTKQKFIDPFASNVYMNQEAPYHPQFKLEKFIQINKSIRNFEYQNLFNIRPNQAVYNKNTSYQAIYYIDQTMELQINIRQIYKQLINANVVSYKINFTINESSSIQQLQITTNDALKTKDQIVTAKILILDFINQNQEENEKLLKTDGNDVNQLHLKDISIDIDGLYQIDHILQKSVLFIQQKEYVTNLTLYDEFNIAGNDLSQLKQKPWSENDVIRGELTFQFCSDFDVSKNQQFLISGKYFNNYQFVAIKDILAELNNTVKVNSAEQKEPLGSTRMRSCSLLQQEQQKHRSESFLQMNNCQQSNSQFTTTENQLSYLTEHNYIIKSEIQRAHIRKHLYQLFTDYQLINIDYFIINTAEYFEQQTVEQQRQKSFKVPFNFYLNKDIIAQLKQKKEAIYLNICNQFGQYNLIELQQLNEKNIDYNQDIGVQCTEKNNIFTIKVNQMHDPQQELTNQLFIKQIDYQSNLKTDIQLFKYCGNTVIVQPSLILDQLEIEQNINKCKIIMEQQQTNQELLKMQTFLINLPFNIKSYDVLGLKTDLIMQKKCLLFKNQEYKQLQINDQFQLIQPKFPNIKIYNKHERKQKIYKKLLNLFNYLENTFNLSYKDNKEAANALKKAKLDLDKDIQIIQDLFIQDILQINNVNTQNTNLSKNLLNSTVNVLNSVSDLKQTNFQMQLVQNNNIQIKLQILTSENKLFIHNIVIKNQLPLYIFNKKQTVKPLASKFLNPTISLKQECFFIRNILSISKPLSFLLTTTANAEKITNVKQIIHQEQLLNTNTFNQILNFDVKFMEDFEYKIESKNVKDQELLQLINMTNQFNHFIKMYQ